MSFRFSPSCSCCCVTEREVFTSLAGWTTISGTWSVDDDDALCEADGILLRTDVAKTSGLVIARIRATEAGDYGSVIVGSNSGVTTAVEVRVEFGASCGEVHIYDAGTKVTVAAPHQDLIAGFLSDTDNTGGAIKGVTFVGSQTNTYTNTQSDDAAYHVIDHSGNDIDIIYGMTLPTSRTVAYVEWRGYLSGSGNSMHIKAYDFVGATWNTIATVTGKAGTTDDVVKGALASKHTGTGADAGKVYIRFDANGSMTAPQLNTDYLAVTQGDVELAVVYTPTTVWAAWRRLSGGTTVTIPRYILPTTVSPIAFSLTTSQRAVIATVATSGTYAGVKATAGVRFDEWNFITSGCYDLGLCVNNDAIEVAVSDTRPLHFILAGNWYQAADGTAADVCEADVITTDVNGQVQEVELLASGVTSLDRSNGYTVYCTLNNLQVNSTLSNSDIFSLFLDGGSHELRVRYEEFSAVSAWGFSCQTLPTMTLLIQLYRGTTKLGEQRILNDGNVNGIAITNVAASLHGDVFCGGINNRWITQATTTSTHNGSSVTAEILDKGSLAGSSTMIAVTGLMVNRCWQCPACTQCDEIIDDPSELLHTAELSVYIPDYAMPLFSGGPVNCTGGTFVCDFEGVCTWSHGSNNAHIKISIDTSASMIRLKMIIFSCAGYSCSGFETPIPATWYSADLSGSDVLCDGFSAVEVSCTVSGTTYTAEVTSV